METSDEEALRELIHQMTDGFNSHEATQAAAMYLPDAELVTVRGEVMRGRSEIEEGLGRIFATRARNANLHTLDVDIRFLRPDVALAHVTNEMRGVVDPDGHELPPHKELSLRVFVKGADGWKAASFHNTMVRPFGT